MGFCAAIKPDGVRCKARAMKSSEWCFNHNPDYRISADATHPKAVCTAAEDVLQSREPKGSRI